MLVLLKSAMAHREHEDSMSIPAPHLLALRTADERVVSLAEAPTRTNLSVATLGRCHKRGELRILKLSPRRRGVRLSDLRAFLDSRSAS
jgi:hypothetical protein